VAELKLTPPQQRFVLAICEGKSQADAYRAAKFPRGKPVAQRTAETKGSEMAKGAAVREALARARAGSVAAMSRTVDDIVAKLDAAYELAMSSDPAQTSGAVAAQLGIGKLLGLYVDRKQVDVIHHKPGFNAKALTLTEDEWSRQFDPSRSLPAEAKDTHNER